ncbi:alkyl sulfatase dimerization domain-containing protein [Nocardiopsis ansamitocini]|uniref:Uncharacterized protein n=1 Tax=Nocardiopsis ansamitocini TaxID=1670832 RepID=A0A9W6P4L9_9ACTN|nr:alkyl sulfatase dimerization domain-containing protein [Nocardiopsis ansamitocini]GLU46972.1 hypothetical protein Nans01_13230 [Nocardiopsis ansamitocini]
MSYPLSYPEPVRSALETTAPHDGEKPSMAPVADTPARMLRIGDGPMLKCVVLEGPSGVVLYGTGESHRQGRSIARAVAEEIGKPVKAIIYGERHEDQCSGTNGVMAELPTSNVLVIAPSGWDEATPTHARAVAPVLALRAAMQYGTSLRETATRGSELSRTLRGEFSGSLVQPTVTVRPGQELKLAGMRIRFFATKDQAGGIGLYLAESRLAVLSTDMCAGLDNLIGVQGPPEQTTREWRTMIHSLQSMDIEHLVGTRFAPARGAVMIREQFDAYLDAIDYSHDQSVRHILAGASPDELFDLVDVPEPPSMFCHPLQANFKGTAAGYFASYLGWFSGNAVDLKPTPRRKRSRNTVELMGGAERVLQAADEALTAEDPQWSAELARMALDSGTSDKEARAALCRALHALGDACPNPLMGGWYHGAALEAGGEVDLAAVRDLVERADALSAADVLNGLRFRVVPEAAEDVTVTIGVDVLDTGERFGMRLRNKVLRIQTGTPPEWSAGIATDQRGLGSLAFGDRSIDELAACGEIEILGDPEPVEQLWSAIGPRPRLAVHS